MEYHVSDYLTADLYIPEKNLLVYIDGPCHFYNLKHESDPCIEIEKLGDRQLSLTDKKILRLNIMQGQGLFVKQYENDILELIQDMEVVALKLKKLIDAI